MAQNNIKCRLAQHKDFEGVMDINRNVYAGFDYLADKYHEYLDNPKRVCVLGELDGVIVSFEMMLIIDDGTAAVYQAGRVKPDLAGRGIQSQVVEFGKKEVKKRAPKVKKYCYTTINRAPTMRYIEANKPLVKMVSERPRITCDFPKDTLNSMISSNSFQTMCAKYKTSSIRVLPPSEAETLLRDDYTLAMSPDGYWIMFFEPMGALACNAEMITKTLKATVFASFDKSTGKAMAISFAMHSKIPVGLRYRMDFYFHPDFATKSKEMFVGHYLKNLIVLDQFWKGDSNVSGLFCKELDMPAAEKVIYEKCNFSKTTHSDTLNPCLLVEWPDTDQVTLSGKAKAKM